MTFPAFLSHNIAWVILFVILFIAITVIEYRDNGHGVRKFGSHETIKFMDHKKHLLIDLRDYVEFEKGYIRGAKNIMLDHLKSSMHEHIKTKDTPILLIAEGEGKALAAAKHLKKQGYPNVGVLKGGLANWKKENLPLTKSKKD